jgi:hypothetical protein
MSRSALAGIIGLLAATGLSVMPAAAGGICDCHDETAGYYVVYAPRAYDYEPRVLAYYSDPRMLRRVRSHQEYAAAYYDPPPPRIYGYRPSGYAFVSRGPAVLVHPYERPVPGWRRRW